jgi:hypothetical protein
MRKHAVLAPGLVLLFAIMVCGCTWTGISSQETSVRIDASPRAYSPMMSSTVGIGLMPNVSGFSTADARYEWNASYGRFVGWNTPGYKVLDRESSVVTGGETVYWTFHSFPDSPAEPVIITLVAQDKKTGRELGNSRMTLGWEQNNTFVVVETIE